MYSNTRNKEYSRITNKRDIHFKKQYLIETHFPHMTPNDISRSDNRRFTEKRIIVSNINKRQRHIGNNLCKYIYIALSTSHVHTFDKFLRKPKTSNGFLATRAPETHTHTHKYTHTFAPRDGQLNWNWWTYGYLCFTPLIYCVAAVL